MAPGHHGDPRKPPRMFFPSNVWRRIELCPERVRRKGSGKLGRKVGFCRGGVGPRLARRLALTTGVFARSTRVFAWSAGDVVSGRNGWKWVSTL